MKMGDFIFAPIFRQGPEFLSPQKYAVSSSFSGGSGTFWATVSSQVKPQVGTSVDGLLRDELESCIFCAFQ